MAKVSVIIAGRCEQYFQKTVESVFESAKEDVEVMAVVDGPGQDPPVKETKNTKVINLPESIGQRAAYNMGVKESCGEYVMKIDAHALLSPGFDVKLKNNCPPKTVVLPEMRRLDHRKWKPKPRGKTLFMYPGLDLYCHYWKDYKKRPEAKVDYPEVMTGQGSCWFTTREWNDYIGLLDEGVGSWGNVGIEVSLRTWLCGGRQIANKNCWQAHWFRVSEGGFPYPFSGRQVARAHKYTWENYYFKDNAFKNQVRPFHWYIKKFAPVPSWEVYLKDQYKPNRVIVYYTDNNLERSLADAARKNLIKAAGPIPIISVSQEPLNFGQNICVGKKPKTKLSMYEQMLEGVKAAPDDSFIYLCEHDVFYHYSHFEKVPPKDDAVWINQNKYHWQQGNHFYLKAKDQKAWSMATGSKKYLLEKLETTVKNKMGEMKVRWFKYNSERPNIDIRHDRNLTKGIKAHKKQIFNIAGWGSPKHFKSVAKYKGTMRFDIIQWLIDFYDFTSYLEIGVNKGHTFKVIKCELKHGVDPKSKFATHKVTSDEYFKGCDLKYDIIFVDGLHEHSQVKRDILNSLDHLKPGGVIVVHDCKPRNEKEQHVPKLPNQKIWVGDGWKAFVELRERNDLYMYVVDTNNGVGIIRRGFQVPLKRDCPLDWVNFQRNTKRWLKLKTPDEFKKFEHDLFEVKKYKPMSLKMMEKQGGRPGTICQELREVYYNIDSEDLKYKLRVCMAMVKSMHRRLNEYKENLS